MLDGEKGDLQRELDNHREDIKGVQKEVNNLAKDFAVSKSNLKLLTTGISLIVSGIVAWLVAKFTM